MSPPSAQETLLRVRALLLDLERHLDRAGTEGDATELARAWVRSAQIEQTLRGALPPEAVKVAMEEERAP